MAEIYIYTLEDVLLLLVSSIPVGFLIGCFPMLIGLTLNGVVSIFKKA